jgi:hypothetical protein
MSPHPKELKKSPLRMPSSVMLCRAVLVTDFSQENSASVIMVTRIGEVGTLAAQRARLLVTATVIPRSPILVTMMKEALRSY